MSWLCSSNCTTQTQAILYSITSVAYNKVNYRMCKYHCQNQVCICRYPQVRMHNINRLELSNLNILDGNRQFTLFFEIGSLDIPYSYSVSLLAELCEALLKFPQGLIKIFGLFHFM